MTATRSPVTLCSFTSWIRGLSPGATALLITVRALTWVTERTVAAAIHGRPNRAELPPSTTIRSRSRWKPEPFTNIRSFLLTIRLKEVKPKKNDVNNGDWLKDRQLCNKSFLQYYSRGDLSLHENENENQQSRQTAGKHHPDGKVTFGTKRTDDPATLVRTRHGESSGDAQFLDRRQSSYSAPLYSERSGWKTFAPLSLTCV